MMNPAEAPALAAVPDQANGWNAAIEALKQADAQRLEPLRLHYIVQLAVRMEPHEGAVRRLLEAKFQSAVAELAARLDRVRPSEPAGIPPALTDTPVRATLADLTRRLGRQPHAPDGTNATAVELRPELHSVRQFRNTWSKLSADKQVARALEQAPPNAGPINSHMLVLRSLELMRSISPDYLNRFMAYADTLLCLDHSDSGPAPGARPRRARSG